MGAIPLNVLPIGINYNSFCNTGKNVIIHAGNLITKDHFPESAANGKSNLLFNEKLSIELEQMVYEISADNLALKKEKLGINITAYKKMLLFLPAMFGAILNAPFYIPINMLTRIKTKGTDHFDSIHLALLTLFYPFYLIFIPILLLIITHTSWSFLFIAAAPLTAKAYIEISAQFKE